MNEPIPPRRSVEPSAAAQLWNIVRKLQAEVRSLQRNASLRNSSISGGEGQKVFDDDGNLRLSIDTSGAVTAYDENAEEVARYGRLVNVAPGEYGVEIRVGSDWVRLGYQTTGWEQIQKPAEYDPGSKRWSPRPHTHPAADVEGAVGDALRADGPTSSAFARDIGATSGQYYAVWMSDNGLKFGKNTSSLRYKENVRPHGIDPARVLKLQPAMFDRKSEDGAGVSRPDEWGLIAEQVLEHVPELVTYFDGEVDGVRYDLLALALLDVAKDQQKRIEALESRVGIVPAVWQKIAKFPTIRR